MLRWYSLAVHVLVLFLLHLIQCQDRSSVSGTLLVRANDADSTPGYAFGSHEGRQFISSVDGTGRQATAMHTPQTPHGLHPDSDSIATSSLRSLSEAPAAGDSENPLTEPLAVKTAGELRAAVSRGHQRILLQQHIRLAYADSDARPGPRRKSGVGSEWTLGSLEGGPKRQKSLSIVGNCTAPPDLEAFGLRNASIRPLEAGQCMILTDGEMLDTKYASLWLHKLYVRVDGTGWGAGRTRFVSMFSFFEGSRVWLTQSVFQGAERLVYGSADPEASGTFRPSDDIFARIYGALEEFPSARVLAHGVHFMDFGGKMIHTRLPDGTIEVDANYATLAPFTQWSGETITRFVDCSFTGMIVNSTTARYNSIIYAGHSTRVWLQGCRFADNALYQGYALVGSAVVGYRDPVIYNDGPETYLLEPWVPFETNPDGTTAVSPEPEWVEVLPEPAPAPVNATQFLSIEDAFVRNGSQAFGVTIPHRIRAIPFTSPLPPWPQETSAGRRGPGGARWAAIACGIAALASIAVSAA